MNPYTIDEFYNQAEALIQRYDLTETGKKLEVSVSLSESKSGKMATVFSVSYLKSHKLGVIESEDQANDFLSGRSLFGHGYSPSLALANFESCLIELSYEFPSYAFSFYPEPD